MTGHSRFGCQLNAGATWAAKFSRIFTWMSTPTPVGMVMNRVSADMTPA